MYMYIYIYIYIYTDTLIARARLLAFFDSEESFWPRWSALHGALEARGP